MKAEFGIKRERQNSLLYKEYCNTWGIFHFHSQIELHIVNEGEIEACINGYTKALKKDQMSVALSYDAHSYRTPESSASCALYIPTFMCEEFIKATKDKRVTNPFITDSRAVHKIKECISEINAVNKNDVKLIGYLYVILGTVMENLGFEAAEESIDTQLSSQLLFYINENFMNDISLESLSAEFGHNPSYISRYFKACFNIGLSQYISFVRLRNALMLMHEKKHSLTYCAFESGFSSMRTFYRVFSNEFGCSPKEYIRTNL